MEPLTTFFWGIFQNILSNRIDEQLFGKKKPQVTQVVATSIDKPSNSQKVAPSLPLKMFKTFNSQSDIDQIAGYVDKPIVYLLIEDSPSTSYNLPAYVIESSTTQEWFLFSRGGIALQGTGGGHYYASQVFKTLQEKEAKIGAWVVSKASLNEFEDGHLLWSNVKAEAIPLLAYLSTDYSWSEIREQFQKFTKRSDS